MSGIQYFEGRSRSCLAGEVLASYRRVQFNSSGVMVYADGGDAAHGVTTRDAFVVGDDVAVSLCNLEGTVIVECSAAIALGGLCYAAVDGKVGASGSVVEGVCVGVGPAAGASGDLIEMLPVKFLGNKSEQTKLRSIRIRNTAAEVNAGKTLLAAIPGFKYRVHDIALISIGGNAAGATTVDITATQSTSVKLLAAAVAGLTQSTYLRAGAANAAILADGVSFVPNDVGTAVLIGKTGGSLTGSTNIDALITYTVEE